MEEHNMELKYKIKKGTTTLKCEAGILTTT
jgi:hypothetical protein